MGMSTRGNERKNMSILMLTIALSHPEKSAFYGRDGYNQVTFAGRLECSIVV
jgi:hypothetical protein